MIQPFPITEAMRKEHFNYPFYKNWIESLSKSHKGKKGKRSSAWKGGKIRGGEGRWYIRKLNHPFIGVSGYIAQSRLVAEKLLGRYLKPGEIIHHINGDMSDDRPENLYLFPSHSVHLIYKGSKNKSKLESNL